MRAIASTLARAVSLAALALLPFCGAGQVAAEPSEAQVAAIKANCRSDYMSYCWSVPRGGTEAAQCLKKNLDKLSPACQQAVKAATAVAAPPSAPAVETKPAAEAKPVIPPAEPAPSASPAATAKAAAPAPEPAGQTQNGTAEAASPAAAQSAPSTKEAAAKEVAPAAKRSLSSPANAAKVEQPVKAEKAATASPTMPSGAAPAASDEVPVIIGAIPPRKKFMVFKNCRKDLDAYCPDVSYGEGRQLRCLFSHKASLSPDCQGALAKLAQ